MKLSAVLSATLIYSISCAALKDTYVAPRDSNADTCSLGIARESGSISWDVTIYNVPQAQRQDVNVIAKMDNAEMGKGQSITVTGPPQPITITNVDNAGAFDYDVPEIKASWSDPSTGFTKVKLAFAIPDANLNWTTADCSPGSVVLSGGIESWSCDFPCTTSPAKEL